MLEAVHDVIVDSVLNIGSLVWTVEKTLGVGFILCEQQFVSAFGIEEPQSKVRMRGGDDTTPFGVTLHIQSRSQRCVFFSP